MKVVAEGQTCGRNNGAKQRGRALARRHCVGLAKEILLPALKHPMVRIFINSTQIYTRVVFGVKVKPKTRQLKMR
jgi:hypothetical protein